MFNKRAAYLPICLDVRGKNCIVVGGGRVAERKIKVLLSFGANIKCLSTAFTTALVRLGGLKKIRLIKKRYPKNLSLKKYVLAVAATDDPCVNKKVAADSFRDRTLVNVADKSAPGNFIMPAILKRKGLVVGVSTSGVSPARAKSIRDRLALNL
ncbi:MAG: bifunctional precorrin-2 dehydrogenase/sirohydrochlorin ferrochelatase [Candidatus Omnitrophica bacterium]|nr:bifunctional precorrin-2 dehydrogenase/sirohydrochlorin ferrochelatase [Candidatus Omnitrophota bacterium]